MKKIQVTTKSRKLLADVFTPVGIYLRLRDRFRDTILLESSDFHAATDNYSFIGIHAIAGIEITNFKKMEYRLPGKEVKKVSLDEKVDIAGELKIFMQHFQMAETGDKTLPLAQSLFGYTTYDAVQFKENVFTKIAERSPDEIPLLRYRLYQYVLIINHFNNELFICENSIEGQESRMDYVESLIRNKDVPSYPFNAAGKPEENMTDEAYKEMVQQGIQHCARGDVFQIVLSRSYRQPFTGDEFNVYRALRNINPSPYLFYFDYGDYRLFGSSPESQLKVSEGTATVHPIAGTFKRGENKQADEELARELLQDKKENAEHVMLVDLARNDLSRVSDAVKVTRSCEIQFFSHVIHLVSEVQGKVPADANPFDLLLATFPAGTLSGAPKVRAMQLIDEYEPSPRSYYGGCIGAIGFDGSVNHAIIIRTFLSKGNALHYRAGAGITISSKPDRELQEVSNKLNALTTAIKAAQNIPS